jgi:hypothetical protein
MGVERRLTPEQTADLLEILRITARTNPRLSREGHNSEPEYLVDDIFDDGETAGKQQLAQTILRRYFGESIDEST